MASLWEKRWKLEHIKGFFFILPAKFNCLVTAEDTCIESMFYKQYTVVCSVQLHEVCAKRDRLLKP